MSDDIEQQTVPFDDAVAAASTQYQGDPRGDAPERQRGEYFEPALGLYLREIRRYALLTAEEEQQLAVARDAGIAAAEELAAFDPADPRRPELAACVHAGAAARQRLVEANLRLVVRLALRYAGNGLPLLDLIQEGNMGLALAATKYDPHRGYRFATMAVWWIRQKITRALSNHARLIRLPVHVVARLTAITKAQAELEQQTGSRPPPERIAAHLGIPVKHVYQALRAPRVLWSLDRPPNPDWDWDKALSVGDLVAGQATAALTASQPAAAVIERLTEALRSLEPREQAVLALRFGLRRSEETEGGRAASLSLSEIGAQLGLSRQGVRETLDRALAKVRALPTIQDLRNCA